MPCLKADQLECKQVGILLTKTVARLSIRQKLNAFFVAHAFCVDQNNLSNSRVCNSVKKTNKKTVVHELCVHVCTLFSAAENPQSLMEVPFFFEFLLESVFLLV